MCIRPFVSVAPRWYMRRFNQLLSFVGCRLNGAPRFIAHTVRFDDFKRITIGADCVLTDGCVILTHDYSYTTGLIALGRRPDTDISSNKCVEIGSNVFEAINSTAEGLGDNVIIGERSLVRGRLESNSFYAGVPVRRICSMMEYMARREQDGVAEYHKDKR